MTAFWWKFKLKKAKILILSDKSILFSDSESIQKIRSGSGTATPDTWAANVRVILIRPYVKNI